MLYYPRVHSRRTHAFDAKIYRSLVRALLPATCTISRLRNANCIRSSTVFLTCCRLQGPVSPCTFSQLKTHLLRWRHESAVSRNMDRPLCDAYQRFQRLLVMIYCDHWLYGHCSQSQASSPSSSLKDRAHRVDHGVGSEGCLWCLHEAGRRCSSIDQSF